MIKKTKKSDPIKNVTSAKSAVNINESLLKNETAIVNSPFWNIWDAGNCYKVRISVPGLSKKDIKVNVNGNNLIISSEKEQKKQKEGKNYIVKQYNFNSWSKTITLPQEISSKNIKINYKEGVLKLGLNKLNHKVV